jgi:spore coat protein A
MKKIATIMLLATLTMMLFSSAFMLSASAQPSNLLDPLTIPKYVTQLTGPPPVYVPTNIYDCDGKLVRQEYVIDASEFYQQILPTEDVNGNPLGQTKVWGYGGMAKDPVTGTLLGYIRNSPAPSFEAIRGVPIQVKWINNLVDAQGNPLPHMFAVDPTLHWANPNNIPMNGMPNAPTAPFPEYPPGFDGTVDATTNPFGYDAQTPVPIVAHLHGGETQSFYDGGPDQWFTANGIHGQDYATLTSTDPNAAVYYYLNDQQQATLWYHDHALGITRINVMSGLAGFYLLTDPCDEEVTPLLPSGEYDMPLVFQDRNFLNDGSFYFPADEAPNPDVHPYWSPEFFGNVSMVDGLVWPNMNVKQGVYRLRLLDGSNARFYNLQFENGMSFTQIATDGGFLKAPAEGLTSLLIAPGERAEILVDFSNIEPGTTIRLLNDANGPYPDGDPADPDTIGQLMQFTVTDEEGCASPTLPSCLNPTLSGAFPNLPTATNTRVLTLTEVQGPGGPLEVLLNGQKWAADISELPKLGTTEDWVIFNPTADTHPIHLHLVQFQLVQRQTFDRDLYYADWLTTNGYGDQLLNDPTDLDLHEALTNPTINVANPADYLTGSPTPPAPNEQGWKDTIQMNPGEVTTIRVRFAQQDGSPYPFDATCGPGYVWHCHIIDHEDNEMMRPYMVVPGNTHVIPEAPLATLMLLSSMGVAFIGFIGFKRWRFTRQK